jgi:putative nucleotidyltransferase with HDIG domain
MANEPDNTILIEQLQVGVYVYLDLGWMNHPFSFNNFKIRSEEQLRTIRRLGLKQVRWDPSRSEVKPLAPGQIAAAPPAAPAAEKTEPAPDHGAMMSAKRARIERLAELREKLASTERAFASATSVVRNLGKTIYAQPEKTLADAGQVVGKMVDELLAAPELAIQVMAEKAGSDEVYLHALNVSVLAMIVARELKLPPEAVRMVGLGAMFHDIGLTEIPSQILNNREALTKVEREFREMHCQYGFTIGKTAGLPQAALNIILQHHENFDGTGYPKQLRGEAIDPLARLVGMVNIYDNLCNPVNLAKALTPHEALSLMFAQQRSRFDPKLLQVFIRFMGVYPPGTVVQLSNEAIGLVIKVNSARPLKPTVIVYDAEIPKDEALLLDLEEEPDINISRAIRPSQLSAAVVDYLNPRRRVSYYFDAAHPAPRP